ncbi:MAG TPA: hypothetical protein VMR41_01100 [Patescibacteria group bacterium]|nr:hypothetical protein [Patescibacteria group bacterium]
MELTWKDKFIFYFNEFRQKLPFAYNLKKQFYIFAGGIGGILLICIVSTVLLLSHSSGNPLLNTLKKNIVFPTQNNNNKINSPTSNTQSNSQNNVRQGNSNTQTNGAKSNPTKTNSILNKNSTSTSLTVTPALGSNSQSSSGNSSSSNNSGGNSSGGIIGTTDLSDVKLYFEDSSGNLEQYVAPTSIPDNLTWQTYSNQHDNYSLDYPVGWSKSTAVENGHEVVSIHPPNTDLNTPIQQGLTKIAFGISPYQFPMPQLNSANASYINNVMVDGFNGTLYTQGAFGINIVAALFKYGDNYFCLWATANDDTMIYVFQHMLLTLQLYGN